jgi:hypothetical protein
MQRTEIDGYTCIFMPNHYYQISFVDGTTRTNTRLLVDYNDPTDVFAIRQYSPTMIAVSSRYYEMLVGYDPEEPSESNGRIEINSRFDEAEDIIQWIYYKTGIKQSTVEHLMRFIQDPTTYEIQEPVTTGAQNNNNNNNSNNPAGGRRRKNRKTRKGRK